MIIKWKVYSTCWLSPFVMQQREGGKSNKLKHCLLLNLSSVRIWRSGNQGSSCVIALYKNKGNGNDWITEKQLICFSFWKIDMLHSTALTQKPNAWFKTYSNEWIWWEINGYFFICTFSLGNTYVRTSFTFAIQRKHKKLWYQANEVFE